MALEQHDIAQLKAGLEALVPVWGLCGDTEVTLLTISENATFIARDPRRPNPVILRVHRPDYHTVDEIRAELAWIEALRAAGTVETAALVPTLSGALIATLSAGDLSRHVVAFEFMEGREPNADAALVPGFRLLGQISARLHSHVETWQPPTGFTRKTWDFDSAFGETPLWGSWRESLGLTAGGAAVLEAALASLKDRLAAYGKDADRFGLVHADLRLANLLEREDGLTVIDFDDCGFSWYMYDFAAAISFFELNPIVPELQAAWLEGYQTIRRLSTADIEMLPHFILFRRILLTAWIASHAETETAKEAGLDSYTEGTLHLAQAYLDQP